MIVPFASSTLTALMAVPGATDAIRVVIALPWPSVKVAGESGPGGVCSTSKNFLYET